MSESRKSLYYPVVSVCFVSIVTASITSVLLLYHTQTAWALIGVPSCWIAG